MVYEPYTKWCKHLTPFIWYKTHIQDFKWCKFDITHWP
nr:MAG TPA: hypothetical protein [Caudoviricetes sp.]